MNNLFKIFVIAVLTLTACASTAEYMPRSESDKVGIRFDADPGGPHLFVYHQKYWNNATPEHNDILILQQIGARIGADMLLLNCEDEEIRGCRVWAYVRNDVEVD